MAKFRPRYTDEFRAQAVVMLEAAGYPKVKGALSRVARDLQMHPRTISRWFNRSNNPPPDQLVTEKKIDLIGAIRQEALKCLGEMDSARQDAWYGELATSLGIFVDKLQILTGGATQNQEIILRVKREDGD